MSSGDTVDQNILAHIARYRLTFQEIVGHLYPDVDPQKVLNRLREQGLVESRAGFGGRNAPNRRAYFLTPAGARSIGAPAKRAASSGSKASPTHLSLLAFCCLTGRPRVLLEKEELVSVFGAAPKGHYHCLERSSSALAVYRVYFPGPKTPPADVVSQLRESVASIAEQSFLEPWTEAGLYRFAVLVEKPERRKAIVEELAKDRNTKSGDASRLGQVLVEVVPGLNTLEEALRALSVSQAA